MRTEVKDKALITETNTTLFTSENCHSLRPNVWPVSLKSVIFKMNTQ